MVSSNDKRIIHVARWGARMFFFEQRYPIWCYPRMFWELVGYSEEIHCYGELLTVVQVLPHVYFLVRYYKISVNEEIGNLNLHLIHKLQKCFSFKIWVCSLIINYNWILSKKLTIQSSNDYIISRQDADWLASKLTLLRNSLHSNSVSSPGKFNSSIKREMTLKS